MSLQLVQLRVAVVVFQQRSPSVGFLVAHQLVRPVLVCVPDALLFRSHLAQRFLRIHLQFLCDDRCLRRITAVDDTPVV